MEIPHSFDAFATLQALPYGILVIDSDYRITFLNHAASAIFDVRPDTTIGQPLATLAQDLVASIADKAQVIELALADRHFHVHTTFTPVSTEPGQIAGCVFTIFDDADSTFLPLDNNSFFDAIIYDILVPHTMIQGYTDLLLQGHLDPLTSNQYQAVEVIRSGSRRITRLTNYLLTAERLRLQRIELGHETIDLSIVLSELLETFAARFTQQNVAIHFAAEHAPLFVQGDPFYIRNIFDAVVDHALPSVLPGTTISITVTSDSNNVEVRFHFPDFDKRKRERIEILGRQAWGEPIAVAKALTELHGGRFWVEYPSETAGNIHITLPRNIAPATEGSTA